MTLPATALALAVLLTGAWALVYARHWTATLLVAALGTTAFLGISLSMGLPRPIATDLFAAFEDVEVLAYQLDEPTAIYVWISTNPPTAYGLPWSEQTARKLHEGARQAGQDGVPLMMSRKAYSGEPMFYPKPVQEPPPKGGQ